MESPSRPSTSRLALKILKREGIGDEGDPGRSTRATRLWPRRRTLYRGPAAKRGHLHGAGHRCRERVQENRKTVLSSDPPPSATDGGESGLKPFPRSDRPIFYSIIVPIALSFTTQSPPIPPDRPIFYSIIVPIALSCTRQSPPIALSFIA